MLKKSVLKTLKKRWFLCLALVCVIVAIMLLSLAPAYILKSLIDNVLSIGGAELTEQLRVFALAYLGMLAFVGVFELLKQTLLVVVGENITKDIRVNLARKLNSIDALYFSKMDSGQLTSIFVNDVDTINTIFTDGLIGMMIDLLKIVGIVVSMFFFSYVLGLVTLIIVPMIYFISHAFKSRMFSAQMKNRLLIGKANNHIGQSIRTKQMLKIFSLEKYMSDKYDALLLDNYKSMECVNFFDAIYSPIIKTMMAITITLLIVLSGVNLNILGISIGMLAGSVTLIESLFSPVENIGMELQNLQSAMSGIKRVNDFFSQTDENPKSEITIEEIMPNKEVAIKFEHLTFGYDEKSSVLSDLNVDVANGEKVTFVGRTGVGKTTLFKLITGLIKGDGRITLNGVDVYTIKNELKPYLFGYVEQSFSYISGSIKENITLGSDKLSNESVLETLDFVLLGDLISSLEDGIDTPFSPNLFSQGELQLLSIARAIAYNPPVLLLDEITANLDTVTEKLILDILQRAAENRTILSISHRESSIIKSDKIITLEKGKIKDIKYNNS